MFSIPLTRRQVCGLFSRGEVKKYRLLFSATGVTFRNADNEANTH